MYNWFRFREMEPQIDGETNLTHQDIKPAYNDLIFYRTALDNMVLQYVSIDLQTRVF